MKSNQTAPMLFAILATIEHIDERADNKKL